MTIESKLIRGKVARVLNSRELVLNVGSEHGVGLDMLFDVLDPNSENIQDPDTHVISGSVASTYRSKAVNIGGSGQSLHAWASVLAPPKWIREYETLKTEESTWEDLDEEDSYVATGDSVVQVLNEEDRD